MSGGSVTVMLVLDIFDKICYTESVQVGALYSLYSRKAHSLMLCADPVHDRCIHALFLQPFCSAPRYMMPPVCCKPDRHFV